MVYLYLVLEMNVWWSAKSVRSVFCLRYAPCASLWFVLTATPLLLPYYRRQNFPTVKLYVNVSDPCMDGSDYELQLKEALKQSELLARNKEWNK